uniref:Uncharacterized protein n=1 Tax=Hucho hucho TaxID=62062 RepID=A0A4W5KLP3_9TELE
KCFLLNSPVIPSLFQSIFEWCFHCFLRIKEWVEQMQQELVTLTDTASGVQNLIQKYFSVGSNDASQLVANAAGNIEKLLANRSRALKVFVSHLYLIHRIISLIGFIALIGFISLIG